MKFEIPDMTIESVLMASGAFSSKSDLKRTIKQNGVKLNSVLIEMEELYEKLSIGDFLNLFLVGKGTPLTESFGTRQLMLVEKGKRTKVLMKIDHSNLEILN